MEFDTMGIRFHKKPFEFLKDWVLVHGDEGSLNQNPGGTAIGLAKKFGKSVLCGHTNAHSLRDPVVLFSNGHRG
jgi:hypothetical protein